MPLSPPTPRLAPLIMVVGSLNIDWTWHVERLPSPGETLLSRHVEKQFGGKGANQAVAAARMGGRVSFVGALGADADGELYQEYLKGEGITVTEIISFPELHTGAANIYLDPQGENSIVVDSGANGAITFPQVEAALRRAVPLPDILLLQLETPLDVVIKTLQLADKLNIRTVLNPSPIHPDFPWGSVPIDTVVLNQHECRYCMSLTVEAIEELSDEGRVALLDQYLLKNMIITRGNAPTIHLSREEQRLTPCLPVTPVDTVGAGDTFAGCLAVQLAEGQPWDVALWKANVAAALATLSPGAQTSMPDRATVHEMAASFPCDAVRDEDAEIIAPLPIASRGGGFTLIEMLVVVAILSIVAALAYPVAGQMRSKALDTSSLSNIRSLGQSVTQFVMDNNNRYPGPGEGGGTRPYLRIAFYTNPPAELILNGHSEATGTPFRRHLRGYQLPQFRTQHTPRNLYTPGQPGFQHEFIGLFGINTELTYYPLRPNNMWGINALTIRNPAKTILAAEHYAFPLNGAAIAGHLSPATPFLGTAASMDGIASNSAIRKSGIPSSISAMKGPASVLFCDGHAQTILLEELRPWPTASNSTSPYTFYP